MHAEEMQLHFRKIFVTEKPYSHSLWYQKKIKFPKNHFPPSMKVLSSSVNVKSFLLNDIN